MSLPVRSSPHRSVTSHYFRNRAGAGDGSRHVADVRSRGGGSKALPARLWLSWSRELCTKRGSPSIASRVGASGRTGAACHCWRWFCRPAALRTPGSS